MGEATDALPQHVAFGLPSNFWADALLSILLPHERRVPVLVPLGIFFAVLTFAGRYVLQHCSFDCISLNVLTS